MTSIPETSAAAKARQVKQQFAKVEDYLSYELAKAVQELPPLYIRLMAGSISLLIFAAIAWAYFSKVDEVATAPGELVASTQVRPVRALSPGSILTIRVKEGQHVNKGDILIERDPDMPQTDVDRLAKSSGLIRADIGRLEAERKGGFTAPNQMQGELLTARLQDFEARKAAAIAEMNRQKALVDEVKVRLLRLQENLDNAKTNLDSAKKNKANTESLLVQAKDILANAEIREQQLRTLVASGATPRMDYLDAKARVIQSQAEVTKSIDNITNAQEKITEGSDKVVSLEKDIGGAKEQLQQAEQAYQGAYEQVQRVTSERQSEILTQLNKRREEQTTVEGQLDKAKKQREQEIVTSPVNGTIYSIKATKGPVQSGEEMLSILPDKEELLLEVKVLNRDIGFIHQGMKAKVKMATFPFQEFGTIPGEVVAVSPNAVVDKDLGLVFPTRIRLNQHSLQVRGKEVTFTPGMSASGEILTRRKSILTFLMEPITRRFSNAFSAR